MASQSVIIKLQRIYASEDVYKVNILKILIMSLIFMHC